MTPSDLVKMRVTNRYRGQEGAKNEGDVIFVTPDRARQLVKNGNAAPITGPSETKPQTVEEKKTAGAAEPSPLLQAGRALPSRTVLSLPRGKRRTPGAA